MGGTLKSFDADAVMHMPGVLAVVAVKPMADAPTDLKPPFPFGLGTAQHAVAVIAEHYWQARTALDALPVQWDDGAGAQWTSTDQAQRRALGRRQKARRQGGVERRHGRRCGFLGGRPRWSRRRI